MGLEHRLEKSQVAPIGIDTSKARATIDVSTTLRLMSDVPTAKRRHSVCVSLFSVDRSIMQRRPFVCWFVALIAIGVSIVSAQQCPITAQKANGLNFSGVKKSCGGLDSSKPASCDSCLCSLTNTFIPALQSAGFDFASAGGFAGAESVLQACMVTLAVPLAAAGVPLSSLLGLTRCPYDTQNYPSCIDQYVSDYPQPMVDPNDKPLEVEVEESFVEDVAVDCLCPSDFDPVCDYNGFWYTNHCVSKCKGAKLVERCSPVFKAIETTEYPFTLYEKHAPLAWKAGCYCSQEDDDFDPVCDINGRQYPSPCYAKCLGVKDVFDCRSLVVDFVLSGEGPIVQAPKVEAQDGIVPDTIKPDVGDLTKPIEPSPKPIEPATPEPPTAPTTPDLPPEVAALFQQLGVDVGSFPPELTMMAYKIIMGEEISNEELKRGREILADQERMAEARLKMKPSFVKQLEVFAATATGNNKKLLDELLAAVKVDQDNNRDQDKESLRTCLKGCKQGKPVCNTMTGEEYASACHARCAGVTDTKPCHYHDDDSGASIASSAAVCSVLTLFGAVAAMHL